MPSSSPIAIIFGSGARVGAAVTSTFLSSSYRVARISRSQSPSEDTDTLLNIAFDLSKPESISSAFSAVRARWGEPSVVIYNAYGNHGTDFSTPATTFDIATDDFAIDLTLNMTSPFVAIKEALSSFQSSSALAGPKTFIFTGNTLNQGPFPGLLTLGLGKAGAAYMVELADSVFGGASASGEEEKVRFFYADERHEDGTPLFTGLGGQAHADTFSGLTERRDAWRGLPWLCTFVSGSETGPTKYKEFRRGLILAEGT